MVFAVSLYTSNTPQSQSSGYLNTKYDEHHEDYKTPHFLSY